jgi:hypothetical protein
MDPHSLKLLLIIENVACVHDVICWHADTQYWAHWKRFRPARRLFKASSDCSIISVDLFGRTCP